MLPPNPGAERDKNKKIATSAPAILGILRIFFFFLSFLSEKKKKTQHDF